MCKVIRLAMADKNNLSYAEKKSKLFADRYQLRYWKREYFKNMTIAQQIQHIDDNGIWL